MFAVRGELTKQPVFRDGQQFVTGRGLVGDRWSNILRLESHGLAGEPVIGGQGLFWSPNGRPEEVFFMGGAKPSLRPQLPYGAQAIYDHSGNIVKVVGSGIVMDAGSRTITITSGTWTIRGNGTITGNLHIDGNITCSGTITDSDGNNGA